MGSRILLNGWHYSTDNKTTLMNSIVTSENIKKEQKLGGKATHLSNLQQMNFNVPPFFVIHPNAFYNALSKKQKDTLKTRNQKQATIDE